MFEKILIANRGEIAVRIARTAKRLGIKSVGVYSDTDKNALHIDMCDEAVNIGGQSPAESYLVIGKILDAAQQTQAEAIHPGYGFLSENADFADEVEKSDLCFIGPTADTIRKMGSKSQAKDLMQASNVPVMPGYQGVDQSLNRFIAAANCIGFPVLLKATAGGGGKGMRVVESEDKLEGALESAKREALAAFGDDRFLIEKYLPRARHLEVQVFGDGKGHAVHLFERDCSIQRRYQKIIEEAPAPDLSSAVREKLLSAGVNAARSIDYRGAGTVEFLYDGEEGIYFMEMNTRLQVEHPVTEAITGIDLVEWQFRVAAGEDIPLTQEQVTQNGHAFEARIYAEKPESDFAPSVGKLSKLDLPLESARVDTGVKEGDIISPYYDPMIAKIITHGGNRNEALGKLEQALSQTKIAEIHTNTEFLKRLCSDHDFRTGLVSTNYIEEHGKELIGRLPMNMSVFAAALFFHRDNKLTKLKNPLWRELSGFRVNQIPKEIYWAEYEGDTVLASLSVSSDSYTLGVRKHVTASERKEKRVSPTETTLEFTITKAEGQNLVIEADGYRQELTVAPLSVTQETLRVWSGADYWDVIFPKGVSGTQSNVHETGTLKSHMPGVITVLIAETGKPLEAGDPILLLEAMKMEHTISAPQAGVVKNFRFRPGDQVKEGELLVDFEAIVQTDSMAHE